MADLGDDEYGGLGEDPAAPVRERRERAQAALRSDVAAARSAGEAGASFDASVAAKEKARGSAAFKANDFASALAAYTLAIDNCPRAARLLALGEQPPPPASVDEEEGGASAVAEPAAPAAVLLDAEAVAAVELLTTCLCNRAAVYVKPEVGTWEEALLDCDVAVRLLHLLSGDSAVRKNLLPKALGRRAKAFESLHMWDDALADLETVKPLLQGSAADAAESDKSIVRVKAAMAARDEKLKNAMLGKLKDLGNSLLGKFGLSLDHFKATKDANTGSYNISFGPPA